MKWILILAALTCIIPAYSQLPASTETESSIYLRKSKTQRTIGNILLWGGATVFVGTMLQSAGPEGKNSFETVGTGAIGAMLLSIPFFIKGRKNRRLAEASASLKVDTNPTPLLVNRTMVPAATIQFRF
ncbi:hypothetical protein [Aridibaculum aurantiacum]|uniref:hypothetical protein n=1 Tax=Aridibaculum aurantiacum TaxID=2810307 RepID=UPI001A957F8A|nr:hypothetical protein [Aridibaculum aurantiacum]